jgi:hypothetical protein
MPGGKVGARAHLSRCFIGKSNSQDCFWRDSVPDNIADTLGDYSRFTSPCPC